MDVIREILLAVEKLPLVQRGAFSLPDVPIESFSYNMKLLVDNGLLSAKMSQLLSGAINFFNVHLTWSGADFLDTVRDDTVWRKTKEGLGEAGGFSFDLMKSLAKGFIRTQIEARTGVKLDI